MHKSFVRFAIIGVLALTLAACTAVRFGYNQGPELVYWWLDRYLDFDLEQKAKARDDIAEWFRWHRRTQLPDYAQLLAKAQVEVGDAVTPAQICRWSDTVQARVDVAFEHALPALADSVRALTPQQIKHMERKYEKNIKEYRKDFLQPDPQERRRMQIERVADRAEMVYGRLNDAQRERIAQLVAQSPFDPQAWLVERQQRQQDVLLTLRRLSAEHAGAADAQLAVKQLYEHTFHSPREPYWRYQQSLLKFNCDFAAQVHNLSTLHQRDHAMKRFKGWADDVRALSGQELP